MAVRAPGDTPFPPDESGAPPFQDDVDLPWWQGGGKGFGGGGPVVPSQGTTLSVNRGAPGPGFGIGGGWRNPFTAPHVDPTTGQPEMLTGPGGLVDKTRGQLNPFGFVGRGNPYWRGAIAAGGVLTPTPAETGEFTPAEPNFVRLDAPRGGGLPAPAPQTYPHMPWPDIGTAPVPAAAPGGAVAKQRPNLGAYGAPPAVVPNSPFTTLDYRPNSGPNERNRGSPVATALDLSRLFGGGQPAAAAAAPATAPASILARPDLAQRVPLAQTPLPPERPVVYQKVGQSVKLKPKFKGSSSSQGGGQ